MSDEYERLKAEVLRRQAAGDIPEELTPEERADWAYGNARLSNDDVTREMARDAVAAAVEQSLRDNRELLALLEDQRAPTERVLRAIERVTRDHEELIKLLAK